MEKKKKGKGNILYWEVQDIYNWIVLNSLFTSPMYHSGGLIYLKIHFIKWQNTDFNAIYTRPNETLPLIIKTCS